jgi:hypothetical protein
MTRHARPPERNAHQEHIQRAAFAVFQSVFCQDHFWEALDLLSDKHAAPDPLGFGYSKPWGQGLGLERSKWIPAAQLCAFWAGVDGVWHRWVAPVVTHQTNGHGALRQAKRQLDLTQAVEELAQGVAGLPTAGMNVAVVLRTSRHTVDAYAIDTTTGWGSCAMMPSGRGACGWLPWPKPPLTRP